MPVGDISPAKFGYTGGRWWEFVVRTNDSPNALVVDHPSAPPQLLSHASPPVARPFQRDLLDLISQLDVSVDFLSKLTPTVEPSAAHARQLA